MATREKTNKQKVLDYVQKQFENAKEMKLFQIVFERNPKLFVYLFFL